MRISAIGIAEIPGRNRGFTLIELMVVLFILGLLSAAVVLAIPDSRGSVAAEAERFAARAKAAQERAIMDNRAVALRLSPEGYAFERREDGEWRPLEERPFGAAAWKEGTAVASEGEGERIVFDPTGQAGPLRLTLSRDGDAVDVAISGGDIHVVRP